MLVSPAVSSCARICQRHSTLATLYGLYALFVHLVSLCQAFASQESIGPSMFMETDSYISVLPVMLLCSGIVTEAIVCLANRIATFTCMGSYIRLLVLHCFGSVQRTSKPLAFCKSMNHAANATGNRTRSVYCVSLQLAKAAIRKRNPVGK